MLPERAALPATLTGLPGFGLVTDVKVPVRTRSEPPVQVSESVCVQSWKAACEPRRTSYGAASAVQTTVRSESQRLSQESKGPNSGCDRAKDRGRAGPATQCPAPGPGCPLLGQAPHFLTQAAVPPETRFPPALSTRQKSPFLAGVAAKPQCGRERRGWTVSPQESCLQLRTGQASVRSQRLLLYLP